MARDAQGRRIDPRFEPMLGHAEKKRRKEADAVALFRRRQEEHKKELDAEIDHQVKAEAQPKAPEANQSLTQEDVERINRETKEREAQILKNPPPAPLAFARMTREELDKRRGERGLEPAKLRWPVPEALARSRARLEAAARNIDMVRAAPAVPEKIRVPA
jgi:hypothetical protein